ncbi:MAG TPA: ABC transporter permease [Planctomycetota bacterium]|jgi:ABC-2 type transport system permease protein|nr:ABC transporter permease [Planctomycetota bacterium]
MSLLSSAWAIARKDLRIYFRDRTGLLLGFALPIALVGVFGLVTKYFFGQESGLSKTTLWVGDFDGSARSKAFVDALRGAATVRVKPDPKEKAETAESLRKKVEDGEAHHALVVEKGFGEALAAGRLPTLRMYRDPDRQMEAQMVSVGLMQAFFSAAGSDSAPLLTARALEILGLPEEWRERTLAVAQAFSTGIGALFGEAEKEGKVGADRAGDGAGKDDGGPDFQSVMLDLVPVERVDLKPPKRPKQLSYMLAQSVSGTGVMMLMFGLVACGALMIRERDQKTLDRIRMSPAPSTALLWGKYLFAAICGAMQLVLLFGFGRLVFAVDILADPVTLAVVSLATLLAVSSFGILVAAWARTQKQADGVSTLLILVMSAVGGAWFPVQIIDLPLPAKIVSRSTITHWAVSAYQGLFWNGKSWYEPPMLLSIGVLLGFALLAGLLARLLFQRRYVGV